MRTMLKLRGTVLGLIVLAANFLTGSLVANAAPVDVSYQVSGSAGAWVLDFSVTNNMPSTDNALQVYLFGIQLGSGNGILSSPANWPVFFSPVTTNVLNGSGKTYTLNLLDGNYGTGIAYGQTLSGFLFADGDAVAPTSVNWVAYGIGPTGPSTSFVYTGPASDYIGPANYNPGFEGVAAAVPAPAPAWLMLSGLSVVGLVRRKLRKHPLQ